MEKLQINETTKYCIEGFREHENIYCIAEQEG